ncbi:MAG: universal stress protein [Deltaproteobacteria bacterium]|nr:universal stress protein [Deltaproteobacteria bacterium]
MEKQKKDNEKLKHSGNTILVAFDFSPCSILALRKARSLIREKQGSIIVFHVIDHDFVKKCIRNRLGTEGDIKEKLFLNAKSKLQDFIRKEAMDGVPVEVVISEGAPCSEINKKAIECNADMIVMGSKGDSEDIKSIFFGSTIERVLRLIKRPVLCVPPEEFHKS